MSRRSDKDELGGSDKSEEESINRAKQTFLLNINALQSSLGRIGQAGIEFIPRTLNAHAINGGGSLKISQALDQLATTVPSAPYSALVLAGTTLYVAQNDSTARETEEELCQRLSKSAAEQGLVVKKIVPIRFRSDGNHPDTIALTGAIKEHSRDTPIYLGLAAFNGDGTLNAQRPASCASCGAVIHALNNNGFNVNVSLYTPTNFPSNGNYKIPQIVLENPELRDSYLSNIRGSLIAVERELHPANERDLYVQHMSRDEIQRTMQNGKLDEEGKHKAINEVQDYYKEIYAQLQAKKAVSPDIQLSYEQFREHLNRFRTEVGQAIEQIPQLYTREFIQARLQTKTSLVQKLEALGPLGKHLATEIKANGIARVIEERERAINKSRVAIEDLQTQIAGTKKALAQGKVYKNTLDMHEANLAELQKALKDGKQGIKNKVLSAVQELDKKGNPIPLSKTVQGQVDRDIEKALKTNHKLKELQQQITAQEKLIAQWKYKNRGALETNEVHQAQLEQLNTSLLQHHTTLEAQQAELKSLQTRAELVARIREIDGYLPAELRGLQGINSGQGRGGDGRGQSSSSSRASLQVAEQDARLQADQLQRIGGRNHYGPDDFNALINPNPPVANNLGGLQALLANPESGDTIMLNVNTNSRGFEEGRNNHWVGLRIDRINRTVVYVDPLGGDIDPAIGKAILTTRGLAEYTITPLYDERGVHPQYARLEGEGEAAYLDGNHVDCGPFLAHALNTLQLQQDTRGAVAALRKEAATIHSAEESIAHGNMIRLIHVGRVREMHAVVANIHEERAEQPPLQLQGSAHENDKTILVNRLRNPENLATIIESAANAGHLKGAVTLQRETGTLTFDRPVDKEAFLDYCQKKGLLLNSGVVQDHGSMAPAPIMPSLSLSASTPLVTTPPSHSPSPPVHPTNAPTNTSNGPSLSPDLIAQAATITATIGTQMKVDQGQHQPASPSISIQRPRSPSQINHK